MEYLYSSNRSRGHGVKRRRVSHEAEPPTFDGAINKSFLDFLEDFMRVADYNEWDEREIEIESGRWGNVNLDNRLCKLCDCHAIEDEFHFIFHCPAYQDTRTSFFDLMSENVENFFNLNDVDKMKISFKKSVVNIFEDYIYNIVKTRQRQLYI